MILPQTNFDPPFNITRAGHVILTADDLSACKDFYTQVIGLIVTHEEPSALYLRGTEEICHHSLVIKKATSDNVFERVGFRVDTDEDMDKAYSHFRKSGRTAQFVEAPYQGRTLHVSDDAGTPLEFCATMPVEERLYTHVHLHHGAAAQRMDHWQILVPDPLQSASFYTDLGFRISDYLVTRGTETVEAVFLHRKNNPWDIVLAQRAGPQLHHFGYVIQSLNDMIRACDIAGNLGWGARVESGPGRHSNPHAYYLYLRDPANHRVELLLPGIQLIDREDKPFRCDIGPDNEVAWGRLHPSSWYEEASCPG